jgi:hypothetical protein
MPSIEDLNYEILLGNSSYRECQVLRTAKKKVFRFDGTDFIQTVVRFLETFSNHRRG